MSFEDAEEKIKIMAAEIKKYNDKASLLSCLNEDIQSNDCFTPSEKDTVEKKLLAFEDERTKKTQEFRNNLDIYHNHILRLKNIIDNRATILEKIKASEFDDISDITNVFKVQDVALTDEFEKYLGQLE